MTISWRKVPCQFTVNYRILPERKVFFFTVIWRKEYETVVDLVPFSASDSSFVTSDGYTILVKR